MDLGPHPGVLASISVCASLVQAHILLYIS